MRSSKQAHAVAGRIRAGKRAVLGVCVGWVGGALDGVGGGWWWFGVGLGVRWLRCGWWVVAGWFCVVLRGVCGLVVVFGGVSGCVGVGWGLCGGAGGGMLVSLFLALAFVVRVVCRRTLVVLGFRV